MNCHEARKWISPYLDSELDPATTFEVSQHLQNCTTCANRFEAERRADEMVRARLSQTKMPPHAWSRIHQDLSRPAWVRRLRSPSRLAMAAGLSLALVASVAIVLQRTNADGLPIVDRFIAAAPDGRPFAPAAASAAAVERALRDEFGLRFDMSAVGADSGHVNFQVVGAAHKRDAAGRGFLEVRLNCCGQPVLLALARSLNGKPADVFSGPATAGAAFGFTRQVGDIHVAGRQVGEISALAVSRHAVSHVLDAIRPADA